MSEYFRQPHNRRGGVIGTGFCLDLGAAARTLLAVRDSERPVWHSL